MRTTAETYGAVWDADKAHGAEYDALQSARAAYRMGVIAFTPGPDRPEWVQRLRNRRGPYDQFDDLAVSDVEVLHQRQITWAREQADSYQLYLQSIGDHERARGVRGDWPIAPLPAAEGATV